jgi:ABC-2 type transport system permease protein
MKTFAAWQRIRYIAYKETLHIIRDPQTLFFTLFIPIVEMFFLGFAINTNIRDMRTVVVDFCNTQESRRLIEQFENSGDFHVVERHLSEKDASEAIVAGRAQVGIVIPEDFSRKIQASQSSPFAVLVDGTVSSIAAEAVNVGNALALRASLEQVLRANTLPVESRPRVLFNPDTKSSYFFLPGLMVVMCQMMATVLSANAIVREKESGTLEQFYMTPVRRTEVILGKMIPYIVQTVIEFFLILMVMRVVFQVPIRGYIVLLFALLIPFTLTMLAFGLLISTKADTKDAAGQMAMGTIIPSIFLSGYVFPLDSMPASFQVVACFIPTTWLIDAARGIILRGADFSMLWQHMLVLWSMAIVVTVFAAVRMRKQVV